MSSRQSVPAPEITARRNASKRALKIFHSMLADAEMMPIEDIKLCIQNAIAYLRGALKELVEVHVMWESDQKVDLFIGHPRYDSLHGHAEITVTFGRRQPKIRCWSRHYGQRRRQPKTTPAYAFYGSAD